MEAWRVSSEGGHGHPGRGPAVCTGDAGRSQAQRPASPWPLLPGQGEQDAGTPGELRGGRGRPGCERTRTIAAAADPGVCPVGRRGRVRLTRPQSSGPALLDHHLESRDRSVLRKRPRSLRKLRVHPAAKTVLRKPSPGLFGPGGSERGHQTPRVSVRVERPLRAGL